MSDDEIHKGAMSGTDVWYESGPQPITNDTEKAVLVVRLGLAMNALFAQLDHGVATLGSVGAVRRRNVLSSIVTSSALLYEALKLCREAEQPLQELAKGGDVTRDELDRLRTLTEGTHPAVPLIKRARNKLGFHWDPAQVRASLLKCVRNEPLVWVEIGEQTVHTLAVEVLSRALLPSVHSASAADLDTPPSARSSTRCPMWDKAARVKPETTRARRKRGCG